MEDWENIIDVNEVLSKLELSLENRFDLIEQEQKIISEKVSLIEQEQKCILKQVDKVLEKLNFFEGELNNSKDKLNSQDLSILKTSYFPFLGNPFYGYDRVKNLKIRKGDQVGFMPEGKNNKS